MTLKNISLTTSLEMVKSFLNNEECNNTHFGAVCDCPTCNNCISQNYGDTCNCSDCNKSEKSFYEKSDIEYFIFFFIIFILGICS